MALSQRAVALMPDRASHRFNLATLLTFAGDLDGAEREYGECLRLDPTQWKAHLALSQLRRQTASANHVESLRTLLSTAGGNAERSEERRAGKECVGTGRSRWSAHT